jgi:putative ABC transport system permease protein
MKTAGWSPFAWLTLDLQRTITLGYLRQRWTRAALIVLSIALGVSVLVATRALNQNLSKAAQGASNPLSGLADLLVVNGQSGVPASLVETLREAQTAAPADAAATAGLASEPGSGGPFAAAALAALNRPALPELSDVQPMVLGRVAVPELDNRSVLMLGVEPPAGMEKPAGAEVESLGVHVDVTVQGLELLGLLREHHPVLLRKELAEKLGNRQKDFHVSLAGKEMRVANIGTVEVRGDSGPLEQDTLFMYLGDAAALVYPHRRDYVSQINISLRSPADREAVRQRVQALVPVPCKVETLDTNLESVRDITAGLELGFLLGGAGALVIGLFLVYLALSVSVAERRHDIGILRSVGATRGQIAGLFVAEAAFLGLLGSLLALPLGYGLARLGLGPLSQALNELFAPIDTPTIELSWPLMLTAVAAGVLTTVVAALVPALQAAAEEPADAVRRVPTVAHFAYRAAQVGGSGLLMGGGLACVLFREYLPLRFGVFAGMVLALIGALVLMPLLAEVVGRSLQPFFRSALRLAGRLAADNLVRSPGRTGLVIGFLAATGALMVQTAGFITSTEQAIFTWLDDKIAADLFVTAASPITVGTTALPMDEQFGDRLRALPEVRAVLPVRTHYLEFRNRIVILIAIDTDAFAPGANEAPGQGPFEHGLAQTLREHPELREPGRALVSDNFAALYHVEPGDRFRIDGLDRELELQVTGKVVDYSWNRGTIIVDRKWYRDNYRDTQVNVFDVYLRPGSDGAAVERAMKERWGQSDALEVVSRAETRDVLARQLRQVYGMAYAQETVVGLVALLGVTFSLSISVLQRRRELGLLRSIGATRSQVLFAVLAEAILMGVIGAVLGFGMGLLLQWYLLDLVLFDESGFVFPMQVPWLAAAVVIGASFVLATLVGLWPAYYATRMRIAEAIQYE